ncbi:MAG: helicase C-terminal domain-containing protein [Moorellaceae bacterium]
MSGSSILDRPYVVVDLETTGLNPSQDRILEIAALRFEARRLVREFSTLVNPGIPVPPLIQRLTGIDDDMVAGAPALEEVLPRFLDLARGATLVAHNSSFDVAFLEQALGYPWPGPVLDTLELSRILLPTLPSHKLGFLAGYFNLDLAARHRALADAAATAGLLEILWEETLRLGPSLLRRLLHLAPPQLAEWFQAAENARRQGRLAREEAAAAQEGLFAAAEEDLPVPPFSVDTLASLLAPGGLLSAHLPEFEYRPEQEKVLRTVAEAFAQSKHALVEAGTGTGKSLAYLLPAIYWARNNRCRVAIATHTINLQEQLWSKDIPLLQKILPFPFKAALVKGRNNYLCRRRLRELEDTLAAGGKTERLFLLRLWRWLELTRTGDWSEIKIAPEEEVWKNLLSADNETCLGLHCPLAAEACFVNAARRRAEQADILILNHSLLLSDLRLDNQVLPPFSHLIIDEAHHLEDTATDHLALSFSQAALNSFFRHLDGGNRQHGYLPRLESLAAKLPDELQANLSGQLLQTSSAAALAREALEVFFASLQALWDGERSGSSEPSLRLTRRVKELPLWEGVLSAAGSLEEAWSGLWWHLEKLARVLDQAGATEKAREAEKLAAGLKAHWQTLNLLLDEEEGKNVSWIEKSPNGFLTLYSAPIEIGPLLEERLFRPKKSIVLTSATLRVNESFDFYCRRTGLSLLPPERISVCSLDSPFNFRDQALVCAATDLPNPGRLSDEEYAQATALPIAEISRAAGGRTLVLCNSHRFLRAVYEALTQTLAGSPFIVLGQGVDGNRSQLLEEFCRFPQAILLGASSFWEGIDLPGDLLRCVIIPRLPFPAPNMPVLAARLENLASQGMDPFAGLSLPLAIIRFRQGFGRLIRRSSDRGAAVVLDRRLACQQYGAYFLKSLPPVNFYRGTAAEIVRRLSSWFNLVTFAPDD